MAALVQHRQKRQPYEVQTNQLNLSVELTELLERRRR